MAPPLRSSRTSLDPQRRCCARGRVGVLEARDHRPRGSPVRADSRGSQRHRRGLHPRRACVRRRLRVDRRHARATQEPVPRRRGRAPCRASSSGSSGRVAGAEWTCRAGRERCRMQTSRRSTGARDASCIPRSTRGSAFRFSRRWPAVRRSSRRAEPPWRRWQAAQPCSPILGTPPRSPRQSQRLARERDELVRRGLERAREFTWSRAADGIEAVWRAVA